MHAYDLLPLFCFANVHRDRNLSKASCFGFLRRPHKVRASKRHKTTKTLGTRLYKSIFSIFTPFEHILIGINPISVHGNVHQRTIYHHVYALGLAATWLLFDYHWFMATYAPLLWAFTSVPNAKAYIFKSSTCASFYSTWIQPVVRTSLWVSVQSYRI